MDCQKRNQMGDAKKPLDHLRAQEFSEAFFLNPSRGQGCKGWLMSDLINDVHHRDKHKNSGPIVIKVEFDFKALSKESIRHLRMCKSNDHKT